MEQVDILAAAQSHHLVPLLQGSIGVGRHSQRPILANGDDIYLVLFRTSSSRRLFPNQDLGAESSRIP